MWLSTFVDIEKYEKKSANQMKPLFVNAKPDETTFRKLWNQMKPLFANFETRWNHFSSTAEPDETKKNMIIFLQTRLIIFFRVRTQFLDLHVWLEALGSLRKLRKVSGSIWGVSGSDWGVSGRIWGVSGSIWGACPRDPRRLSKGLNRGPVSSESQLCRGSLVLGVPAV